MQVGNSGAKLGFKLLKEVRDIICINYCAYLLSVGIMFCCLVCLCLCGALVAGLILRWLIIRSGIGKKKTGNKWQTISKI
jgi:hypothetical protein